MKTCKHCGNTYNTCGKEMCTTCSNKYKLLPRYNAARDLIRVKCGLPPLSSDENTCSIVD